VRREGSRASETEIICTAGATGSSISPPPTTLIYNGIETGDYPTTAQLLYGNSVYDGFAACTATLIGCDTVLTAAHCVCPMMTDCANPENVIPPEILWVFLQNAGTYAVSEVHVHPLATIPGADVAVLKLTQTVTGVTPTPINDVAPLAFGTVGTIVGFGVSDSRFGEPGVKRFGQIETIDCAALSQVAPDVSFTNEELICWRYEDPGNLGEDSNVCYGDSGGPLYATVLTAEGPRRVVAGVTSGGFECRAPTFSFDANVYQSREFILSAAGGELETEACGDLPPVGSPRTVATTQGGEIKMDRQSETKVFAVPPGVRSVRFTLNGDDGYGSKSLVFYVKRGKAPTADDNDCAWTGYSNFGLCTIESPLPGNWYVRVEGDGTVTGGIVDQASYQVTMTAFDVPPSAGRARISVEPRASAISPGGILPYSFTVTNLTQASQTYELTYRFIDPSGREHTYGPYPMSLAPGAEYKKNGRLTVKGENSLGFWTFVVEVASDAGIDSQWSTFEVQNERATSVRLRSNELTGKPGGTWPFFVELENLTGKPQQTSLTIRVTEPSGKVGVSDPLKIRLVPGTPWSRIYMVGHDFSAADVGEWKVVVEATTGSRIDREEIRFPVIGAGKAAIRVIEGAITAKAVSSNGKAVVGQAWGTDYVGNYIWTAEGGLEKIGGDWSSLGPIAISDDASTVVGHILEPYMQMEYAAIWTRASQKWEYLDLYNPAVEFECGGAWTAAYDMSADGRRVVGLTWDTNCNPYAFQWTRESGMTLLPRFTDAWASRANVISDDGSVIGGWDASTELGTRRAAMWVADEPGNPSTTWTETLLGSLQPSDPVNGISEVQAINASGTRLYGDSPLDDRGASFIWTAATGIGLLAQSPASGYGLWPTAASDDGRIVIGVFGPMQSWVREAIIITPERGMMKLDRYLTELGVDLAGAGLEYLGSASAITPDGKTIVGYNWAEGQAWVVTLP
jgi:hypothetical protein